MAITQVLSTTGYNVGAILEGLLKLQPGHDREALILRLLLYDRVPELWPLLKDEELHVFAINLYGFSNNSFNDARITI